MQAINTVLLTLLVSVGCAEAYAQKAKVRTAREHLEANNYRAAIADIDEAVKHEETRNSQYAWYWRGVAYMYSAMDTVSGDKMAPQEASRSFLKTLELDPAFGTEINGPIYTVAVISYNEGVKHYQSENYKAALAHFRNATRLYDAGGASRFAGNEGFKSAAEGARLNAAYAAYNAQDYSSAEEAIESLFANGATKDETLYQILVESYQKQGKDKEMQASLAEARKLFPNSEVLRNLELNALITGGGDKAALEKKLKAALEKDPTNPTLHFNLANIYREAALVKNGEGVEVSINAKAVSDAERSYKKAIELSPNEPDYQYNLGTLYYGAAGVYNRQLRDMGTGDENQKKYDAVLAARDGEFRKALVYFERVYTLLNPRAGSLPADKANTYRNTLIGLKEIHDRLGDKAKAAEFARKIEELPK